MKMLPVSSATDRPPATNSPGTLRLHRLGIEQRLSAGRQAHACARQEPEIRVISREQQH